eukprot:6424196-Amphidinium_carterae.1
MENALFVQTTKTKHGLADKQGQEGVPFWGYNTVFRFFFAKVQHRVCSKLPLLSNFVLTEWHDSCGVGVFKTYVSLRLCMGG